MKLTTLLAIGMVALWHTVASAATIAFETANDFPDNFTHIVTADAAKLRYNSSTKAMWTTAMGTSIALYTPGGTPPSANVFSNESISVDFSTSEFSANPSVAIVSRVNGANEGITAIANLTSATQVRLRLGYGSLSAPTIAANLDFKYTVPTLSTNTVFRLTLDLRNVIIGADTFVEVRASIYNANTNSLIYSTNWQTVGTANLFTDAGSVGLRAYSDSASRQLSVYNFEVIPEPSTLAFGGIAAAGLLGRWLARRRKE